MRSASRSLPGSLRREEREIQRRISAFRRLRHHRPGIPTPHDDGSVNGFEAVLTASVEHHDEVVRRRLADKSRALAEVLEQVREGTYGLCRACGRRIPRRRLEAVPTATLCVPCQERREAAQTTA